MKQIQEFQLEHCIAFITSNASKKLADYFNDVLVKHGISRTQWIALYYLNQDKMNQKELAAIINIKSSTVARLVDRMERDKLIVRERSSQDRRVCYLKITPKGIETINSLLYLGKQVSDKFIEEISPEELDIFNKVLKKLVANTCN